MRAGNAIAGARLPYLGQVGNLSVAPVGYDGATVSWTLDQLQPIGTTVGIYADGVLSQIVPSGTTTTGLVSLGDGTHTLTARVCGSASTAPQRIWNLSAQRVWLRWAPSTAADLTAYVVQQQSGQSWQTIATITRRTISELAKAKPTSGTGSGRLSVFGSLTTTDSGTVELRYSSGALEYWLNGSKVESQLLVPLSTLVFGSGLRVYVEDIGSLYVDGDSWTTSVGISTNWQLEPMAAGTYTYRVLARDRVGNLSVAANQITAVVSQLPEQSAEPAYAVVDNGNGTYGVSLTVALPSDGSTLRLYSNFNRAIQRYESSVWIRAPLATISSTTTTIGTFPAGTLKMYLWTERNGLVRDDLSIYTVQLPPTPEDIGIYLVAPQNPTLTNTTDGTLHLSFSYDFEAGADATAFEVTFQDSEPQIIETNQNIVSQTGALVVYSVPSLSTVEHDETALASVRATDGNGHYGPAVSAACVVDTQPPPTPTLELAMPS